MYNDRTPIQEAYEKVIKRIDEGPVDFIKKITKLNQDWKIVSAELDHAFDEAMKALNEKDLQKRINTLLLTIQNLKQQKKNTRPETKIHYEQLIKQLEDSVKKWQQFKGK